MPDPISYFQVSSPMLLFSSKFNGNELCKHPFNSDYFVLQLKYLYIVRIMSFGNLIPIMGIKIARASKLLPVSASLSISH